MVGHRIGAGGRIGHARGQRQAGQVTPVPELLVEAGRAHQISLRLPKHAPATLSVTPKAGARAVPISARAQSR